MNKWLLVNPSSWSLYSGTPFTFNPTVPLGLLCVAAELRKQGDKATICDMNAGDKFPVEDDFDIIGFTSSTPLFKYTLGLWNTAMKIWPKAGLALGGPHVSAVEADIDIMGCTGEFENYDSLDDLEFPAYDLIDAKKYQMSRLLCRKTPVAYLETSRGCYGKCTFCDKSVQGHKMRFKSPERVMAEIRYVLGLGYKEIQFVDDMFTADIDRVYDICRMIRRSGLKFPWYPRSGVRADKADPHLYKRMKQAGCYRLPFGVESGSQRILNSIKKGITLEQVVCAVEMCKGAGMESEAFFIMGLPGETAVDLRLTIDFALKLKPDYLKAPQFACPYPNTPMFDYMKANGQIKSENWSHYHYLGDMRKIYDHDTLHWDVLEAYRDEFVRRVIKRPGRLIKAGAKALITGKWKAIIKG